MSRDLRNTGPYVMVASWQPTTSATADTLSPGLTAPAATARTLQGTAQIVIEPSEWRAFCPACSLGIFTETEAESEQWAAEHVAEVHS